MGEIRLTTGRAQVSDLTNQPLSILGYEAGPTLLTTVQLIRTPLTTSPIDLLATSRATCVRRKKLAARLSTFRISRATTVDF